jgi:protein-tyrosine kinase
MTRLNEALRRARQATAELDEPISAHSEPAAPDSSFALPETAVSDASQDDVEMSPSATTRTWFSEPAFEPSVPDGDAPLCLPAELAHKLVTDPATPAAAVEQYRRLAAALHRSQAQFGTKVVMVASAISGEGKSLSVCNLALTLSESYRRRVLLIDADLRRPSLQQMLQLPPTLGLSEGLRAEVERPLPLFKVSSRLMVLPAGRPDADPMGGLASVRMSRVVSEAASLFDWVLIDTPPVAVVPDAKLLAAMVDAAVLVIHAGKSPYDLIRHAIDAIGPEKIVGVVLNAAEQQSNLHASGYYGGRR